MRVVYRNAALAILAGWLSHAGAAELPEPGEHDARVGYVTYAKDEVMVVKVRRGVVTRIVLGDGEKIQLAGTGLPADCAKDELDWCVHAAVGEDQVWVKPRDGAKTNNLELKTNLRDYSIEFETTKPEPTHHRKHFKVADPVDSQGMFRVIVRYPINIPPLSAMAGIGGTAGSGVDEHAIVRQRLQDARPIPRNWKYSMQTVNGGEAIAPSMVFDDGRFTYFRFPANREIPSIYYISQAGEESRINFHMVGDLVVVQRLGQQFVLRLGNEVTGIWNDAYDAAGVPIQDGVTVPGVVRAVK